MGFLTDFIMIVRRDICLRDTTKHLSVWHFMVVFMSYFPHFWGPRAIYNDVKSRYIFESYDQKLVVFALFGCFYELLPMVLWFLGDLQRPSDLIHVLGFHTNFTMIIRPDTCLRDTTKNSSYWRFMVVIMIYCP